MSLLTVLLTEKFIRNNKKIVAKIDWQTRNTNLNVVHLVILQGPQGIYSWFAFFLFMGWLVGWLVGSRRWDGLMICLDDLLGWLLSYFYSRFF